MAKTSAVSLLCLCALMALTVGCSEAPPHDTDQAAAPVSDRVSDVDVTENEPDLAVDTSAIADSDWPHYGRTPDETHFSPLDQINDGNIDQLNLAWYYDIDAFDTYTSPLEVDGVLYFGVGHSILHALDARTGDLLWQFDPHVAETDEAQLRMRAGWGIRGIAYTDGKIFTGTRDGRLLAVDAANGELLWSVQTLDQAEYGYITGPPWVAGDKVVIGFGGADYGPVRGYVTAYDINTGEKAWRFHVVPGNPADGFENAAMEMAAETWTGEWWTMGGGGAVWNAMAYDPDFDRIYIGTGNGWPWNQKIRSPGGGDNLFLSSIVALDAQTGDYVWHYQTDPGNTWDFNNAMDIQLTELEIDGELRSVIIHAPKNGFFYVLDRETGQPISAEKFTRANWAERIDLETGRPVTIAAARYPDGEPSVVYPWPSGAHGPQTMSYNPNTGLAYIPIMDGGRVFVDPPDMENWRFKPDMFVNTGLGRPPAGIAVPPATSSILAWNPTTQEEAWTVPLNGILNGGTITTAGNLVFQGHNTGRFVAYAADSGDEIWSFDAQDGILGNAITYAVDGTQYVSVITGFRSSFANNPNWDYLQQQRRMLTFSLGATETLPAFDPTPVNAIVDPTFVLEQANADIGAGIYNSSCVICHGAGMIAGGAAPDLRASGIPLNFGAFAPIVRDGALMERGMPSYGQFTDAQLEGLQHYIRLRANQTAPAPSED